MPCINTSKFTDLEWKLIYVGSAEDETYDQLLESVLVGPVNVGNYRFIFEVDLYDATCEVDVSFSCLSHSTDADVYACCTDLQADPPDPSKIRDEDIIGVTVLLLTCSYMGQEFVRVGYYVNNDYDDEQLREEPPPKVSVDRVQRNILADKPRVTKFPINFHPENNEHGEEAPPLAENAIETNVNGEEPLPSPEGPAIEQ